MSTAVDRLNAALEGRYRVERELGAGGMATVYLAEDLKHDRQIALKVLRPELSLSSDRFFHEIRVTARLQHPGIVPLFDSGDADGLLYYVMPFVDGETLRDRLDRAGPMPVAESLEIARSLASTLTYAHGRGVVHRDIKPSNILFSQGQALIADFGIAMALSAAGGDRLTAPGESPGTPIYMSPEQALGEDSVDGRTDVYSLGCMLHEMLAGEPPFDAPTLQSLLARKLTSTPPTLTSAPPEVARAVRRCLEIAPEDRYGSASDFGQVLVDLIRAAPGNVSGGATAADAGSSIVVLPLRNLSPDPDNAYFADGLTEEIISDLSQLKDVRVISRTSAMRYRGSEAPLPVIARELDVRYVLEGSVRKAGQSIRVTTQLIEALADDHLWSGKFSGTIEDVFEIQERISREIVDALEVSLSREDVDRMAERREDDPRVLELLMRVRHEIWRVTPEGMARAEALLAQADELVGESAALIATRAHIHFQSLNLGFSTDGTRIGEAEELARRALAMDQNCVQAYTTLAWIYGGRQGQTLESLRLSRKAYELDPGNSEAAVCRLFVAAILGHGDPAELSGLAEQVVARDPFLALAHVSGCVFWLLNGQHERALAAARRSLELDPSPPYRLFTALPLLELGRRAEAEEILRPVRASEPEGAFHQLAVAFYHGIRGERDAARSALTEDVFQWAAPDSQYSWNVAQAYAIIGDAADALGWLERAVDNQFWNYPFLAEHERLFDPIRGEARFAAIVARARERWEALEGADRAAGSSQETLS